MTGEESGFQAKLFYHQINLDQKVPKHHVLRKIQEQIDFDFIYQDVRDHYVLWGQACDIAIWH